MRTVVHWKRTSPPRLYERPGKLTPEEQECVRIALRVLRIRYGSYAKMAKAMRVHERNARRWADRGSVNAGVALAVARLAGVTVDAVLSGEFPVPGGCPFCGRTD